MNRFVVVFVFLPALAFPTEQTSTFDVKAAERFAKLALACVDKEYPNKIPINGSGDWLRPVVSPDRSDPKLAHLDGLNLSRAWMLEGILSALPNDDPRRPALQAAADAHRRAGLAAVTGEHYEGGHWLGSFAVYLTTRRGISAAESRAR